MSLPQGLLGLLLSVLAAIFVGACIHFFGGDRARSWAVPVAAAVLFGGAGHAYNLPDWALIGGVLVAPLIFHRTVRRRLQAAAHKIESVELGTRKITLRRVPDYSGRHVGVWTSSPEGPAKAKIDQSPLVVFLDFMGEIEEEYQVILWSGTTKRLAGELILYCDGAQGPLTGALAGEARDSTIADMPEHWVLRASPGNYGSQLLDDTTIYALAQILDLRTEGREMFIHVQGQAMKVVATRGYSDGELRKLLPAAGLFFLRVRGEL